MLVASLGAIVMLIGIIWLIVIAVQTGQTGGEKALWAIVNLLCQPIGGIVFYIVRKQGLVPLLLVIVGWILTGFGYYSMMGDMMNQMPR